MVLFCDSFDVDRDVTSLTRRYGALMLTSGISFAEDGYEGGKAIQFSSLGPNNFETLEEITTLGDTINVSLRIMAKRPRSSRLFVCGLPGLLLKNQFEIFFARPTAASDDFFLRFFVGQTLIHETRVLDANTWHHLEFFGNVHPSVGTMSIRIDEVVEFQASNIQTAAFNQAGWGRVGLGGQAEDFTGFVRLADFVVADTIPTLLGDRSAGFMGDVIVEHIWPTADGIWNLGTPSSGSDNYLMVDDSFFGTVDDDTTYIEDPAAPTFNIELFQMSEPIRVKGAVLAAHVSADCKIDSGSATHIHLVGDPDTGLLRISGSANFQGITNTASYERKFNLYVANFFNPLKPWILANFRDLQWGYANLITTQPRCTRFFIEVVGYRHKNVEPQPLPSRVPAVLRPIWDNGVRVTSAFQTTTRAEQEEGGEVRRALQRRPIRTIELSTTAINRDMATHASMAAARGGRTVHPLPLYSDHSKLTVAYAGGTTLFCDTLHRRFFPGQRLRVLEPGDPKDPGLDTWIFQIDTVRSDRITVTTTSVIGAPSFSVKARVYPLLDAEIALEQTADLVTDQMVRFATRILEVQDTSTLPLWWEGPIDSLYAMRARNYPASLFEEDDAPIWDVRANWGDSVTVGFSRGGDRYKIGKGFRTELDADRAAFTIAFTVRFFTRFDVFRLIALHEWCRGSTRAFWLANPQTTWEISSYGTNQVIINEPSGGDIDDITDLIRYIAITEGTLGVTQIWDVASVVDNGATWTINVVANPLITFPTVANTKRVAPAHNVRFATDELTEGWITDTTCDLNVSFIEMLDEQPAQILNAIPGSPKALPDQVPDLFFWFDPQRNIYTDRTFDPVKKAYVECVGWPHIDYKADVILDARAVKGKVLRESEGIPLPYISNAPASITNPPYATRDGVKLYGGGQRDIANFEAYWGAAVEGGHPAEDNILWDNNKGMTLIVIVVQSSSGPFFTPQSWIDIREDNPNIPIFQWDAAGRGPSGINGAVRFHTTSGGLSQSMVVPSIDNWSFTGFSQRILPVVVRWDPNQPFLGAYIIGGRFAAGTTWTNHQTSIRIPSRTILPTRWFTHMSTALGDPVNVGASGVVLGQQAIRSMFGGTIMLKDFLCYKRGLSDDELDSLMAEFRSQYGNAFTWDNLDGS
jgi:hypothetical protein